MAEFHEYSAKGGHKLPFHALIALIALVISIFLTKQYNELIEIPRFQELKNYPYVVGPSTMAGLYAIIHSVFTKYLWPFLPGVPNLKGTWIGCALASETESILYGVWTIEQDWNKLAASVEYYKLPETDQTDQSLKKSQETNGPHVLEHALKVNSFSVTIGAFAAGRADMQIAYEIDDDDIDVPNYYGLALLTLTKLNNSKKSTSQFDESHNGRLHQAYDGKYFTNRPPRLSHLRGTHGRVTVEQISTKSGVEVIDRRSGKVDSNYQKRFMQLEQKIRKKPWM